MNIFNMPEKIAIISDLMFPVTALPNCLLTFIKIISRLASLEFISALPCKMTFNLPPAHGEVTAIFR